MYELENAVVFDNLNDYFINAKNGNTEMYFAHFLCRYELSLTVKVKRFLKEYSLGDSRTDDLKQIFTMVLWDKLKSYEASNPIPFLQTVKYNILHAWHEYISTTCGATTVHSDKVYALIRKTAGIYYSLSNASDEERITAVCIQTKLSEDKAKEYIRYAEQFRFSFSLDFEPYDTDELRISTIIENRLNENNPSAEDEYFHLLQKQIIANTAEKLKTQELQILSLTLGVCPFCLRFIPKSEHKTYEELALIQGVSGGDVIEKKRKRILKKFAEVLKEEGY